MMMRTKKDMSVLMIVVTILLSCGKELPDDHAKMYACPMECEGNKTYVAPGSCPICKMDVELVEDEAVSKVLDDSISDASIFHLTSKWNTQEGRTIELRELKGEVLVVVMVYSSCKAACPRLVADMKNIYSKVNKPHVRYVLVSIDPETDTPAKLKRFASDNELSGEQWILLQGTVDDVREFANVLSVKYKLITPLDFSHSNIISVFNKNGELVHQQEGLGVDNNILVEKVLELSN